MMRLGMNGTVQGTTSVPVSLWWIVLDAAGNRVPELSYDDFQVSIGPDFWGYDLNTTIPAALSPGQYTFRGELRYNGQVQQLTAPFTIASPGSSELLLNGGFEEDANGDNFPDAWRIDPKFVRSSDTAHGGSYSGKFVANNNATYRVWQWMQNIAADAPYRLTGYVNIPASNDTFQLQIEVSWWSDDGTTLINTTSIQTYTASTNSAWSQFSADLVAPPGTKTATVRMNITSLQGAIYVDDFSFRRQ